MSNPYLILNITPEADRTDIMKAQILAMREKKHDLPDIQLAAKRLLDPSKRLAADFMFPTKIKAKRPQKISVDDIQIDKIDLNDIDEEAFNSLK